MQGTMTNMLRTTAFCIAAALAMSPGSLPGTPSQGRPGGSPQQPPRREAEQAGTMDRIAERYVKLVLAVGQHDRDYVDAYYGPAAWKTEAESRKAPLEWAAGR